MLSEFSSTSFTNLKSHRPDIDGLRAIAILSVIAFHAFPQTIYSGFIGVDIFFVISGFLISSIILTHLSTHRFSFADFYERRIKRIFPALILVLAACTTFGWFALLADEYKQLGKHVFSAIGFLSNITLFQESGYFDNASETKPLMHLWSLGIEEQFYLIWPLLLWAAWVRQLNIVVFITVLFISSFAMNLYGIHHNTVATFYLPHTRCWELLLGALLAAMMLQQSKNTFPYLISPTATSFIGFVLLSLGFVLITKHQHFPGSWALLPTIGTALIISAGAQSYFNRKILAHPFLVWFGLISYPLYLWHWPLLAFARIIESEVPATTIRMTALLLSVALAWLTYRFIEAPIRFGRLRPLKAQALIALLLVIGGFGAFIFLHEGLELRGSIQQYTHNKNELIRTPAIDEDCLHYINNKKPTFPYCRFTDAKGKETVAVIGDSHAHVAYPGIAKQFKKWGINTVLLANSGCPPYLGAAYGTNQDEKALCKKRIEELLQLVVKKSDIRQVYIFTRGTVYITGKYYGEAEKGIYNKPFITPATFIHSAQVTIDLLKKNHKRVYFVTENPELPISPEACVLRPFRKIEKTCAININAVKKRQQAYLKLVQKLHGVKVINTLDAFCPTGECLSFKNNRLLYADYDHLSLEGSDFQAQYILAKAKMKETAHNFSIFE